MYLFIFLNFYLQPGECKIGIMPGHIHKKGRVGKSSTGWHLFYDKVNASFQKSLTLEQLTYWLN